jgi:spermidine synthase
MDYYPDPHRVIFEEKDDYSHIQVVDELNERIRYLYFEDSIQGEMYLDHHQAPVLEYIALMLEGVRMWVTHPANICMGGLGTASIYHGVKKLWGKSGENGPEMSIVELDARIIDCARAYFRLPDDQNVVHRDFRFFCRDYAQRVSRAENVPFDAIFVDCYSATSIPPALMTREFMELIGACLSVSGIAAFNLWGDEGNSLWKEQLKTIDASFRSSAFVTCPKDHNLIVFASNFVLPVPRAPMLFKRSSYPVCMLRPALNSYYPDMLKDAEVMTDENLSDILSQHAEGI